jgi:hypothetical protein
VSAAKCSLTFLQGAERTRCGAAVHLKWRATRAGTVRREAERDGDGDGEGGSLQATRYSLLPTVPNIGTGPITRTYTGIQMFVVEENERCSGSSHTLH